MSYQVQITSIHVPEALAGVPLPIEIVGANGCGAARGADPERGCCPHRRRQGPGAYVVRAELPSGRWLSDTASATTDAAGKPLGPDSAVLDFNAAETPMDELLQPELAAQTVAKNTCRRGSALLHHHLPAPAQGSKPWRPPHHRQGWSLGCLAAG